MGENSNIQHKATEKSTSNRELERLEEKQNRNLYLSETARHRESNNEEDMGKGKQNFKYQNTKYLTYSSRTGRSERNNDHYYRGNYNTGESSKKQAQEGRNVNTQQ